MIGKGKFKIITAIITVVMIYLYMQEPKHQPKVKVDKTWDSLIKNCGYRVYVENSYKANYLYSEYIDSGEWTIEGTYIASAGYVNKGTLERVKIKMNPSQFVSRDIADLLLQSESKTL